MFGEDFLGLRELGIASELGVSSLSVPKKLLRPKGGRTGAGSSLPYVKPFLVFYLLTHSTVVPPSALCRSKPLEPPPLFPPPPPFVPLESTRMEDEIIGLLRPFYKSRFDTLAQSQVTTPKPPPSTADGVTAVGDPSGSRTIPSILGQLSQPSLPFPTLLQPTVQQPQSLILPDDAPSSAQTKMGPLGQIASGKSTNAAAKKKQKKEKDPTSSGGGGVPGVVSGLVGGGMNGVINMNVGNGTSVQQMTVAGSQPGHVGGTIGVMQTSTMTQAGAPGQTGTAGDAPVVMKKRGGPGRGKKGKMDLASRVVIATAS